MCKNVNASISQLFDSCEAPKILGQHLLENHENNSPQTAKNCAKLLKLLNNYLEANKDPTYLNEFEAYCEVLDVQRREKLYSYTTKDAILQRIAESASNPCSRECLLIRLLLEAPVRDDLQVNYLFHARNMIHPPYNISAFSEGEYKHTNFLFDFEYDNTMILLINHTKNIKSYGPQQYIIPENLAMNIRRYALNDPYAIKHYPFIFGKSKHSTCIKRVLVELGYQENGAINFLRRAVAESARQTKDPEKIARTCVQSFHRPSTSKLFYENPN